MVVKVRVLTEDGLRAIDRVISSYYSAGLTGKPFSWLDNRTLVIVDTFATAFLHHLAYYLGKDWKKHIKLIGQINIGSKYITADRYMDKLV